MNLTRCVLPARIAGETIRIESKPDDRLCPSGRGGHFYVMEGVPVSYIVAMSTNLNIQHFLPVAFRLGFFSDWQLPGTWEVLQSHAYVNALIFGKRDQLGCLITSVGERNDSSGRLEFLTHYVAMRPSDLARQGIESGKRFLDECKSDNVADWKKDIMDRIYRLGERDVIYGRADVEDDGDHNAHE